MKLSSSCCDHKKMKAIFYITILHLIYVELAMAVGGASGSGGAGGSGGQRGQKRPSEQIGQGQSSSSSGGSSGNRAAGGQSAQNVQQQPVNQRSLVNSSTVPIVQIGLYEDSGEENKVRCTKCSHKPLIKYEGEGKTKHLHQHYVNTHKTDDHIRTAFERKTAEHKSLGDAIYNDYEYVPEKDKYRCKTCTTERKKTTLIKLSAPGNIDYLSNHTRRSHSRRHLEIKRENVAKTEKYLGSSAAINTALKKMHDEIAELSNRLTSEEQEKSSAEAQRRLQPINNYELMTQMKQQQAGQGGSSQQRPRLSQMTMAAEQMWPYASGGGQQQQSESQLLAREIAGQFTGVRPSTLVRGAIQQQPSRLGSGSISGQIAHQSVPVPSSPSINFGVTPDEIASFLGEHPTPSASQGGLLPSRSISRQIAQHNVPASPSLAFGESMAEGARQLYEEDEVQSAPQRGQQTAQHIPVSEQMQTLQVTQPHQPGQLSGQSMAHQFASFAGQHLQSARPSAAENPSGLLNRMTTIHAQAMRTAMQQASSQANKGKGLWTPETQAETQQRSSDFMRDARRTGTVPATVHQTISQRLQSFGGQMAYQSGSGIMPPPRPPSFAHSSDRATQTQQAPSYGAVATGQSPLQSVSEAIQQTYGAPGGSGHAPQALPTQYQPSRLGSGSISRQIAEQSVPAPSFPSLDESMLDIARQLHEEDEVQSAPQTVPAGSGHAPLQSVSGELRQTFGAAATGQSPRQSVSGALQHYQTYGNTTQYNRTQRPSAAVQLSQQAASGQFVPPSSSFVGGQGGTYGAAAGGSGAAARLSSHTTLLPLPSSAATQQQQSHSPSGSGAAHQQHSQK